MFALKSFVLLLVVIHHEAAAYGTGPCASNPCKNGATCVAPSTGGYKCYCMIGWTGLNCDRSKTDPCSTDPCLNGGACVSSGTTYTCTCAGGWTGDKCQTAPNPCAVQPCKNGGTCTASGSSFTCTCAAGWTGSDCTTASDPCAARPCHNGGTCTASGSSITCTCAAGWAGSDCTTDNNYCLQNANPCKNGGTCVKAGDSYECRCMPSWAGTNCDVGSAQCASITDRLNCGWGGVTSDQCNKRSCCFDDTKTDQGLPACFFSDNICNTDIPMEERVDCDSTPAHNAGYYQCIGWGCCYDPDTTTNSGPACYRKANKACVAVKTADRVAKADDTMVPNLCTANGWCYDASVSPFCFTITA